MTGTSLKFFEMGAGRERSVSWLVYRVRLRPIDGKEYSFGDSVSSPG